MTKSEEARSGFSPVLSAVFIGLRYSILLVLISVFLLAILFLLGWDWIRFEQAIYEYVTYAAIVLGSFVAGHKLKTKGWLAGVFLAFLYWLLTFILVKAFGLHAIDLKISLIKILITGSLGIVGGIIGVNV